MSEEKEAFLDRWSRLKREQPEAKPDLPEARQEAPPPPLQPVEELKPESDFKPFMQAKVDPATRRSALKKLFADAHYNVPDPFEAYSEDYTRSDPIPAAMLLAINRVRDVAVKGAEKVAEEEKLAEQAQADARAGAGADAVQAPTAEAPADNLEGPPGKQDA